MLHPAADDVLTVPAWASWSWLTHGFGTRRSAAWPPAPGTVTLKQTHSAEVWAVREGEGCLGEGDALVSATPGLLLAIRTADCVPVLLADPVRHVVAAVHAGWRGTAAGIAGRTVETMVREFGARPAEIAAVIGPAIGLCCFEVGPEVAEQFPATAIPREGRHRVDLAEENRRQLAAAGVGEITLSGRCTHCEPEWFHSFRRDRALGRMTAAIGVRA